MGRFLITCLMALSVSAATSAEPTPERFEFTQTKMAIPIKIVLYAADNTTADEAARAAFGRFHRLNAILSDYDPESELRRLCDTSSVGNAVRVSDNLWRVLERAQSLSERSDGAFDVTIGPVVRLWRAARRTKELPPPESLEAARSGLGIVGSASIQRNTRLSCCGRRCDWTWGESPKATPWTKRWPRSENTASPA